MPLPKTEKKNMTLPSDQDITGQSTNWQGYFGVLQHNLAPKGAYTTAVETLLAS